MQGKGGGVPVVETPNPLHISWHDSAWNANLISRANVLEYFAEPSNPFYDRQCNNQVVKMQRTSPEQLLNMTGPEYALYYAQEPLYVIRKQFRHSPTQVTAIANYYIISGVVYQAPDLASVINSRVLSSVHNLKLAFNEVLQYSRYHPAKGYWWDFGGGDKKKAATAPEATSSTAETKSATPAVAEERATLFQKTRVDSILAEFVRKFPPPATFDSELKAIGAEDQRPLDSRSEAGSVSSSAVGRNVNEASSEPPLKRHKTEIN